MAGLDPATQWPRVCAAVRCLKRRVLKSQLYHQDTKARS